MKLPASWIGPEVVKYREPHSAPAGRSNGSDCPSGLASPLDDLPEVVCAGDREPVLAN
jgi:hypothetical protein